MSGRSLRALTSAVLLASCGEEVPHGGAVRAPQPIVSREPTASELLPGELDLVVRIDLARLRQGLGPLAFEALSRQMPGDPDVQRALGGADVVTIALRTDDVTTGDRMIVVEGRPGVRLEEPTAGRFARAASPNARLTIWDAEGEVPRASVARVLRIGDRAAAFVTPLYADAVGRVVREGADAARGQPLAEGLISVDLRSRPLRASLAERYPSIAEVLAGVTRLRATANVVEGGIGLDAEILAKDARAAARVTRFLELLRDNAGDRDTAALRAMEVDGAGSTVHVRWTLPAEVVLTALSREPAAAGEAAPEPAPEPAPTDAPPP